MNKKDRLADFASRVKGDPTPVRTVAGGGRYWTVHPMADELELLATLGLASSSCTKVDLYWEYGGDVKFVQIYSTSYFDERPPGLYTVERPPGLYACAASSGYINIVVVVKDVSISSGVVDDALRVAIEARIDENALKAELTRL
jgi:hypothetical protein